MFLLSKLFQLVFKHANKEIWSNPKSVRKGLTTVIAEYAHANISDTDFNKYFSGKNKGRSLVGVVQDEIEENKFQLDSTLEDFFELLEESTNLSVSIQISLKKSYKLNHAIRPYLFVVECFYYALISYHQSNIAYKEVDFSQESQPISKTFRVSHFES